MSLRQSFATHLLEAGEDMHAGHPTAAGVTELLTTLKSLLVCVTVGINKIGNGASRVTGIVFGGRPSLRSADATVASRSTESYCV